MVASDTYRVKICRKCRDKSLKSAEVATQVVYHSCKHVDEADFSDGHCAKPVMTGQSHTICPLRC